MDWKSILHFANPHIVSGQLLKPIHTVNSNRTRRADAQPLAEITQKKESSFPLRKLLEDLSEFGLMRRNLESATTAAATAAATEAAVSISTDLTEATVVLFAFH